MAYATFNEVIARRPLMRTAGINEADVSSAHIYYAEAQVNGWFAGCFTTPFSPVPPQITEITIELTWINALAYKDAESAIV
jgi:hypothetical protein